jgi:FG-GAP repeat/Abnormal spindle-like microcephaly-assoc'd, ASPM-SPD-2-Hydin
MTWTVAHCSRRSFLTMSLAVVLVGPIYVPGQAQVNRPKNASLVSQNSSITTVSPLGPKSASTASANLREEKPATVLSSLSLDAKGPISAALGKDNSAYWVHRTTQGLRGENPLQALVAEFREDGAQVASRDLRWGLEMRGYGYGDAVHAVKAVTPRARENRVEYQRDGLTEWYENGPLGLEQGFTLAYRPGKSNGQALTVELALHSDLLAALAPDAKTLELRRRDGKVAVRYTGLKATDATGKELPSWLEVRGERLLVRVEDTAAKYPVVVDPWIWVQQAELTAADGAAPDGFGYSVAASGSTVVVGAYRHTVGSNSAQGAAYVFVQNGGVWTHQAELTAADGAAFDNFGHSVGMDGSTVVVGAYQHTVGSNSGQGAAYVFAENGGTWSQQAELTASDGAAGDLFGDSVAVSGNTVVVGANFHTVGANAKQGAAYVFSGNGGTWSQQAELSASDGAAGDWFGYSVVVSGSTAVVGVPGHLVGSNFAQGSAYVFAQSGGIWSQQAELTSSDGAVEDNFGSSVAVDASTVVVGAGEHKVGSNSGQGAAYVFVESGGVWSQQAEMTSSDGMQNDIFGSSVAVSGSTAMVGAPYHRPYGAAYVFVESGGTWSQQAELTDSTSSDNFGASVALSGNTGLAGASNHTVGSNPMQGAAFVFVPAPPSYTLSANPSGFSVTQGSQGTSTITITPSNGFSGNVSFMASGLPSGVTASFSPNPATDTSTLTLAASPTATTGFATVTVTGTSGNLTQTTTVSLFVMSPPNFALSAAPSSLTVMEGGSATSTITITPSNGFSGSVSLSASGLPSGVTASFNPNPAISTSTLRLRASGTATLGTATVPLTGMSGGLTQSIPLTSTVTPSAPEVRLSPPSLNFGSQAINTTSAAKTVTLSNIGTATLNLSNVAITLGTNFSISNNNCGSALAAGKTCKVSVTFTPAQLGTATDTLSFIDDASDSPQTLSLSGTGYPQVTLTPSSHTFPKRKVGSTSLAYQFTLKNNLPTTLTGISFSTAAPFAVSASTCGTTLNSKASCTISVTFSPTATGTATGTLEVSDSANDSPQTTSLSGTGD